MLSVTSDYVTGLGSAQPYLQRIAEHGFSHVHWCHQWNTDFLYTRPEIDAIAGWLKTYNLKLNGVHGSDGVEKRYLEEVEYQRLAGLELVINRMQFTAELGADVLVMHIPSAPSEPAAAQTFWDRLRRSLDALQPVAERLGIRIAVENGGHDHMASIAPLWDMYPPEFLGLCYDAGHSNIGVDGIIHLDVLRDRLLAMHLHDNDGQSDEHKLPFTGTLDWQRLTEVLARSSYRKGVILEVGMRNTGISDEDQLLDEAYRAAVKLQGMIDRARAAQNA